MRSYETRPAARARVHWCRTRGYSTFLEHTSFVCFTRPPLETKLCLGQLFNSRKTLLAEPSDTETTTLTDRRTYVAGPLSDEEHWHQIGAKTSSPLLATVIKSKMWSAIVVAFICLATATEAFQPHRHGARPSNLQMSLAGSFQIGALRCVGRRGMIAVCRDTALKALCNGAAANSLLLSFLSKPPLLPPPPRPLPPVPFPPPSSPQPSYSLPRPFAMAASSSISP